MNTYSTSEGDMADEIAFKQYGTTEARVVEQLLDANPGLADYGPVLPAGVVVALPDIDVTAKATGTKLWD